MGECRNCESFVTEDYVRVFSRRDDGTVGVCPDCEDLVRGAGGKARDARAPRRSNGGEPSEYDPAKDSAAEYATDGGESA